MGKDVVLPVQVGGPRVCSEGVKVSLEWGSPGLAIWARIGKESVCVGGCSPRVRVPGSMVRGHRTGRRSLTSQSQAPGLTEVWHQR